MLDSPWKSVHDPHPATRFHYKILTENPSWEIEQMLMRRKKTMDNDKTALNTKITAITVDKSLTDADRKAAYAELLGPAREAPDTFGVFEVVLVAAPRVIAVSSNALQQNAYLNPKNAWPVLEIYEINHKTDLSRVQVVTVEDSEGHERFVFRHVELLGASAVMHTPMDPLGGNARRVAVLRTEGPLRVFVDTAKQAELNGQNDNDRRSQGTRSGNADASTLRRPYGC